MDFQITMYDPDVAVYLHEGVGRIGVCFGGWPTHHTTWFMTEARLDSLTDNLLKAKLNFITKTKGAHPEESAPEPKEDRNAEV